MKVLAWSSGFGVVLFGLFAGVWLEWSIKISIRLCAMKIKFSKTSFICLSFKTSLFYISLQILLSTYHPISTNLWKLWSHTPNVYYYFLLNITTVQYTVQLTVQNAVGKAPSERLSVYLHMKICYILLEIVVFPNHLLTVLGNNSPTPSCYFIA